MDGGLVELLETEVLSRLRLFFLILFSQYLIECPVSLQYPQTVDKINGHTIGLSGLEFSLVQ